MKRRIVTSELNLIGILTEVLLCFLVFGGGETGNRYYIEGFTNAVTSQQRTYAYSATDTTWSTTTCVQTTLSVGDNHAVKPVEIIL
ncbi:MAG: hypothetical protein OEV87_12160 [Phycisphaerae bacterium]|nr:hypothetical protein [Phycisphaerae bacterium]